MNKIDFKKYKFFVKPCFICNNLQWDSYGCEYSNNTWNYCDNIDNDIMDKLDLWNKFPNIESPKKCTRKKLFEFNIDFDYQHECDYFSIKSDCEDVLGVGFLLSCELDKPKIKLANRIAGGLADFNFRMRTFGRIK